MTLIKIETGYYESEDKRYVVRHMTGTKSVNCGKISKKMKRDEWWLKDRENCGRHLTFNSLKLAEHYILTGEYRAF